MTENNGEQDPYKWGLIYYSKNDSRTFVPQRYGFGYTLNFATPGAYIVLLLIIGLITFTKIYTADLPSHTGH